ncbi:hypothetical protein C2S51_032647 [Perilla frutescens var. frutescens]|nr:hypothetical protein C2S51_032647 [Perilla frutescens var. frutescens]
MDVGGNNLSGKHLPVLRFLRLRNNEFYGTIPRALCQLSELQVMDLANNNLTGSIPHCFGNLSAIILKFYNNDMWVPGSLSQVMKGVEQEYTTNYFYVVNLDLSSNHLVGEIPWELTNLSGLLDLNLSRNHLRGQIPAEIGDMKSLESLDLSINYLWGIIQFLFNIWWQSSTLLQRKCVNDKALRAPGIENHEAGDEDSAADRIWFYGFIIAGFATGFWAVIGVMVVKRKWRHAYFSYIQVVNLEMGRRGSFCSHVRTATFIPSVEVI